MKLALVHKTLDLLSIPFRWQPLTFRGALALILGLAALYYLAFPQKDLVAATLGGGLLALTLLTAIFTTILRFRIAKRLTAEARFDRENAISGSEIASGLLLRGSSVPPYFSLSLARRFEHPGVRSPQHIVRGRDAQGATRHLIDSIFFPHRGLWQLDCLSVELEDALGFCRLSWQLPLRDSLEVQAPTIPIAALPIVAASSRAGDQLDKSRDRSGDPFDLKPYDPSDGIRRILWKTYARSGELVVRRPEPAIIPEGEVAIFLIAKQRDDVVAGALQHYLSYLYRQQIDVLFGTDGLHFHSSEGERSSESVFFCSAPEDIQRAINRSVWSTQAGTGEDFESFLQDITNSNRVLRSVIVFAAAEVQNRDEGAWFQRILQPAGEQSVKLSIALVQKNLGFGYFQNKDTGFSKRSKLESGLLEATRKIPVLGKQIQSSAFAREKGTKASLLPQAITNSGSELHMVQSDEQ